MVVTRVKGQSCPDICDKFTPRNILYTRKMSMTLHYTSAGQKLLGWVVNSINGWRQ